MKIEEKWNVMWTKELSVCEKGIIAICEVVMQLLSWMEETF